MSQDKYEHLTEPTFGTVLHETNEDRHGRRLVYVFAPNSGNEAEQWLTSYSASLPYHPLRFSTSDVWERAKDPNDALKIIYDPRVDYV